MLNMKRPTITLTQEKIAELRPHPVDGLESFDIKGLANYIKNGHAKNIIFVQGAGLSVAAGIPDFRTPGTGLYSNLQKYNLPYPEAVFSIDYFDEHPEAFYQLAKETMPGNYKATLAHYFPVLLDQKHLLKRVYTQNIDGLERVAGLDSEKLCECHGTYYGGRCRQCKAEYLFDEFKDQLLQGEIVKCTKTADCDGIVKPNIVFYGEGLPERFFDLAEIDFDDCDLLIVIGTSLAVSPVNSLTGAVKNDTVRVLINNEKVQCSQEDLVIYESPYDHHQKLIDKNQTKECFKFDHITNIRDIYMGGDCQVAVYNLVKELGWLDEFKALVPAEILAKYETQ